MQKSMKNNKTLIAALALLGTFAASTGERVRAQGAVAGTTSTRFTVDLKDATLRDALEMVFQAAGNPSHSIDEAATQVRIGSASFKDQEWREIVRSLATLNKFSFRRESGVWIISPRTTQRNFSVVTTSNSLISGTGAQNVKQIDFSIVTRSSQQQNTGGNSGSSGSNSTLDKPAPVDSNNPWSIIEPLHIYAGSIALLFEGGTSVSTESFIVPSVAFSSHLGGALLNRAGYVRDTLDVGTTNSGGSNSGGSNSGGSNSGTSTSR